MSILRSVTNSVLRLPLLSAPATKPPAASFAASRSSLLMARYSRTVSAVRSGVRSLSRNASHVISLVRQCWLVFFLAVAIFILPPLPRADGALRALPVRGGW